MCSRPRAAPDSSPAASSMRAGAGPTDSAAAQVLGAARELSHHSESLHREAGLFVAGVKAA